MMIKKKKITVKYGCGFIKIVSNDAAMKYTKASLCKTPRGLKVFKLLWLIEFNTRPMINKTIDLRTTRPKTYFLFVLERS